MSNEAHDERCEQRPGGEYYGRTVGEYYGDGTCDMPIPCHCRARESGRRQAERELAREAAKR